MALNLYCNAAYMQLSYVGHRSICLTTIGSKLC